jgi:integrase
MLTLFKRGRSPFWQCAFYDNNGTRIYRSTKTTDRKQAENIAAGWDTAVAFAMAGKLTTEKAREVIAKSVEEIYIRANAETMPSDTVKNWCKSWLAAKEIEAEPTTASRYQTVIEYWLKFLGAKSSKDLSLIRSADVLKFRDLQAETLSRHSANLGVKVLRVCFNAAFKQGIMPTNPAAAVDMLKQRGEGKRRPFTLAEISRVLKVAKGSEWEGMVLFGLYTGARLSDLSRLTWRAVDLDARVVSFIAKKTERRMSLPLAQALVGYLSNLPATDDPDAAIFPKLSAKTDTRLSEGFRSVLADAGLAKPPF